MNLKWKLHRFLVTLQTSGFISPRLRVAILRAHGLTIGTDVTIFQSTFFGSANCEIGDGSFISVNCFIDGSERVSIGKRVYIAAGAQLVTGTHVVGSAEQRAGEFAHAPVVIGDGCWIGAGVMVLPGVVIARGCVIGAGSLVTKHTEADGLYLGRPARRVRDLAGGGGVTLSTSG